MTTLHQDISPLDERTKEFEREYKITMFFTILFATVAICMPSIFCVWFMWIITKVVAP